MPRSELKIDQSFIHEMGKKDVSRIVVEKSVEIGHELGMKVLAEDVDTREQLEFLEDVKCDLAQGHFFSRPLPLSDLLKWLKRSH